MMIDLIIMTFALVGILALGWLAVVVFSCRNKIPLLGSLILVCVIVLTLHLTSLLFDVVHRANADTDGQVSAKEAATSGRGSIETILSDMPDNETTPGYSGTSLPERGYGHDDLINAGDRELSGHMGDARATTLDQPDWDASPATTEQARAWQADPASIHDLGDFLSGKYEGCEISRTPATNSVETHQCDEWPEVSTRDCSWFRIVRYRHDRYYRCQREHAQTRKECISVLTKRCSRQYENQQAGALLRNRSFTGFGPRRMVLSIQNNGVFRFTSINRHLWNVNNGLGGTLTFSLNADDLPNITRFEVHRVWSSYRLNIYVNDIHIEQFECSYSCDFFDNLGLDLRPHLKARVNTIRVMAHARFSNGRPNDVVEFRTSFIQCDDFTETWSETCED